MPEISAHNSQSELLVSPELVDSLGFKPFTFTDAEGNTLPYRQFIAGKELPGKYALLIFFHGTGSVGTDNYLQTRIPGPPTARFFRNHPEHKAVVLLPQCAEDAKWVDVSWSVPAHDMPETPSFHMKLALGLLDEKLAEFDIDPERIYAGGISMGGIGAWDIVSRRPELFSGVFPICGGADTKQAPKLKHLAVYCVHGDTDTVVLTSRSRDMVKALRACGNERVVYDEVPNTQHNCWDHAFADDTALEYLFGSKKI